MAVALTVPAHYQRDTPPSGTNQTWCCWFKINDQPGGDLVFNAIIAQDAGANSWINVEVDADTGDTSRITVWANPTAGGDAPRLSGPLVDYDEWYFVALVKAGNNYTLYWRHNDDDTLSSTSDTWSSTIGTTKIRFGAEHQIDVDTALDGALERCRIFPSALSESDVLAESNSPTAVAEAWADWPIVDTATHTADASGNNRPLTATTSTGSFADTTGPTFDVSEPAGAATQATTAQPLVARKRLAIGAATAATTAGETGTGGQILRNSAEGGTDETGVTTGNSGGSSGDAWSQVVLGTGSAIVYDSAQAAHGDLAYSIRQAASQVAFLLRTFTADDEALVSFYLRFPSLFTVTSAICQLHNGSGNAASLNLTTTGRIQVNNAAGTTVFTTDLESPLEPDTWYRVELRAVRGTGTSDGTIEFAYYLGDTHTPVESFSSSSVNAGTAQLTNARIGRVFGATADTTQVWIDSIQIATAARGGSLDLPWPMEPLGPATQESTAGALTASKRLAIGSATVATTAGPLTIPEPATDITVEVGPSRVGTVTVAASRTGTTVEASRLREPYTVGESRPSVTVEGSRAREPVTVAGARRREPYTVGPSRQSVTVGPSRTDRGA